MIPEDHYPPPFVARPKDYSPPPAKKPDVSWIRDLEKANFYNGLTQFFILVIIVLSLITMLLKLTGLTPYTPGTGQPELRTSHHTP